MEPIVYCDYPGHRLRRRRFPSRSGRLCGAAGMTTAEYAIGTLAACGFAALLYRIITSQSVSGLLEGLVHRALGVIG